MFRIELMLIYNMPEAW